MNLLQDFYRVLTSRMGRLNLAGQSNWMRYGLALLYVVAATLMRFMLPLDSVPYVLYMPGMYLIAFALGRGPAFAATFLSIPATAGVAILHHDGDIGSYGYFLGTGLYLLITLTLAMVCDAFRLSLRQRQADIVALLTANEAQRNAEAQLRLLNHELGHRLKNTLAMVQAIANQTLRRAATLEEARPAFEARLIALGKAQDVLTGQHWESATLGDVVDSALVAHRDGPERFQVSGPEVRLSSRCSLALSLALHELATNAAKYGALSTQEGRIAVNWRVEGDGPEAVLTLEWLESGGPPVVAPERTGFGSVMIERSLTGYFKGAAKIAYPATGVHFTLTAPVTYDATAFSSGKSEIQAVNEHKPISGVL